MYLHFAHRAILVGLEVPDDAAAANCKQKHSRSCQISVVCLLTSVQAFHDGSGIDEVTLAQHTGQLLVDLGDFDLPRAVHRSYSPKLQVSQ